MTKIIISILVVINLIFFTTLMYRNAIINKPVLKVYSLEGESEDLIISNGLIIISSGKHLVHGGKLQYIGDKQQNIKSYTKTIYQNKSGNKEAIVTTYVSEIGPGPAANGMIFSDELLINPDLGEISGEKLFSEEGLSSIKDDLYFSLDGLTNEGKPVNYQVKLKVNEIKL